MTGIKMHIDINYELADKIVLESLKITFNDLTDQIRDLKHKIKSTGKLELWQKQDLQDFRRTRKAMKRVLQYHMTPDEQTEFFNND
jgi:hypothetical protein